MKSSLKLTLAALTLLIASAPFAYASHSGKVDLVNYHKEPAPREVACVICCGNNSCNHGGNGNGSGNGNTIKVNLDNANILPLQILAIIDDGSSCGCIRPCWWRNHLPA